MTRIIQSLGRGSRLNLAGFALACIALFVALGGPGYAASGLPKDSVKSKTIVNGQVKSADLQDNAIKTEDLKNDNIGLVDLSAATKSALLAILDGSVTTPKLADGAVTTPKLADNAVNSVKIADNTVTGADVLTNSLSGSDLAPNSVGASELAANTVQGDEVENFSLAGVDIGKASGTWTYDPPSIAAGDCDLEFADAPGATTSDQVTVSPRADFNPETSPAVFYGQASAADNVIRIVVCNPSNAAVDLPSTTVHFTVIEN